ASQAAATQACTSALKVAVMCESQIIRLRLFQHSALHSSQGGSHATPGLSPVPALTLHQYSRRPAGTTRLSESPAIARAKQQLPFPVVAASSPQGSQAVVQHS